MECPIIGLPTTMVIIHYRTWLGSKATSTFLRARHNDEYISNPIQTIHHRLSPTPRHSRIRFQ
uniref:Uncharacterized protein n=1 Tax=Oryza brachyantha TaxID=4533 RepID=J3MXX0_ORYBR